MFQSILATLVVLASFAVTTSGHAQSQEKHTLALNVKAVCEQLESGGDVMADILRSQLSIQVPAQLQAIPIDPDNCTAEALETAIDTALNQALSTTHFVRVKIRDTASGANTLTEEVVALKDEVKGLKGLVVDRYPLNLQNRAMQLGSEIVYTYAAVVGRTWTPAAPVAIDGKFCGKKKLKKDRKASESAGGECAVVELREKGQFSCIEADDVFLPFRNCYELAFAHVYENGKKTDYGNVDRSSDQLPSEIYLPLLAYAEKIAGVKSMGDILTLDRLRRVQKARNEHEYERTRVHIGALGAITDQGSQSLVTAGALHLYLSEQPWLPGRLDLIRRTSVFVMLGDIDAGAAKAQTLGVGIAVDLVRGFALSVGYSRYTLDSSIDPAISEGTEVQTGSGILGLSINSEIISGNKQAFAGLFSN